MPNSKILREANTILNQGQNTPPSHLPAGPKGSVRTMGLQKLILGIEEASLLGTQPNLFVVTPSN